jgi:hypothetical protein
MCGKYIHDAKTKKRMHCKKCRHKKIVESNRRWQQRNPESWNAYKAKLRKNGYHQEYYKKNRGIILNRAKEWYYKRKKEIQEFENDMQKM